MTTYKTYLRGVGRKPLNVAKLRTVKEVGHRELLPVRGVYVHGGKSA